MYFILMEHFVHYSLSYIGTCPGSEAFHCENLCLLLAFQFFRKFLDVIETCQMHSDVFGSGPMRSDALELQGA